MQEIMICSIFIQCLSSQRSMAIIITYHDLAVEQEINLIFKLLT